MSKVKAVKITRGQMFWYVEVKYDGAHAYKQDSRFLTLGDALVRVKALGEGTA